MAAVLIRRTEGRVRLTLSVALPTLSRRARRRMRACITALAGGAVMAGYWVALFVLAGSGGTQ